MRGGLKYSFGCALLILATVFSCETNVDPVYKDYFIKYYGGDGDQVAKDFVVNDDGTIIMVGTWLQGDSSKLYVVKADLQGKVIWKKKWGGDKDETAQDIDVIKSGTLEGSYLLLSNVKKDDLGKTFIKVLRFDGDGSKIDSLEYNPYVSQFANSITALTDGGFVFTGNTTDITVVNPEPQPEDKEDLISVRFDQNLIKDETWLSFGGEELGMGVKILEITPTRFYFGGYSNSTRMGSGFIQTNFWYSQLSAAGSPQGGEFFIGDDRANEFLSDIVYSGNVLMSVGTQSDASINKIYITATDKPLNPPPVDPSPGSTRPFTGLWERTSIGPDRGEGISVCAGVESNTFWILGNEITTSGRDLWIEKIKYNSLGVNINEIYTSEFSKRFGGANNDDTGSAIHQLPNGDLLILGTMELVHQTKMALIKVKPNGSFE